MIKPRKTRAPERSDRKVVRCAVYTRKSTEEGLDQDFNSLDAQRESAEAYIRSQAHEGWRLVPTRYDDGGFSGGNLDRPALAALVEDRQLVLRHSPKPCFGTRRGRARCDRIERQSQDIMKGTTTQESESRGVAGPILKGPIRGSACISKGSKLMRQSGRQCRS